MRHLMSLLVPVALGGCQVAPGGNPAFLATGEVIAFGGGNGGATNACVACHGLNGEGDGRLTPRLAGLDAGYLHRQLDDYASGRRDHAEMRAVARRLRGEDRAKVSAYYAALPAPSGTMPWTSALYRAKCAECHGPEGEGLGPGNPPLAGQPAAYVEAQLHAWRAGKRRDPLDVMLDVSRALTPEEVRQVASPGAAPHSPARPPQVPGAYR
jgi:cytochrome c553